MCVRACENFGTNYHLIEKLVSELRSVEMNIVIVKFGCGFAVSFEALVLM